LFLELKQDVIKNPGGKSKRPVVKEDDLNHDQMDELFEAFTLFDKDYNGAINSKELGIIMRSVGLNATETELDDMVKEADSEANGMIDFPEFVSVLARKTFAPSNAESIREAFHFFDKDNTGYITAKKLTDILHECEELNEESDVEKLIKEASVSGYVEGEEPKISFEGKFKKLL
jgi:calmodulin